MSDHLHETPRLEVREDGAGHPADQAIAVLRQGRPRGRSALTTLSVDERLLVGQVGMRPLGMVTGSSVVVYSNFARLGAGLSENCELTDLTDALVASRHTAIRRMREAAKSSGADGVLGVSLEVGDLGGHGNLIWMTATGTTVAYASAPDNSVAGTSEAAQGSFRQPNGDPFTALMSGQEFHLLRRAGYLPLGVVSGTCAYHVGRRAMSQWLGSVNDNVEMKVYTEALYDARELAMGRLQDRALELGADGVVGVTITERTGVVGGHVIEFAAIGTAVRLVAGEHQPLRPQMLIDLARP